MTITAEHPQVVGQGWSSIIRIANGMDDWGMIFTPGADGVRGLFANFTLDGNSSNQNVFVASSSGNSISNNVFTSVADQATTDSVYSGIHLEYAATECIVTGNVLETSSTAGRTHALIREDGIGGTGVNIISGNVARQNGAGTPSNDFAVYGGAGSLVKDNAVDGVIVP